MLPFATTHRNSGVLALGYPASAQNFSKRLVATNFMGKRNTNSAYTVPYGLEFAHVGTIESV